MGLTRMTVSLFKYILNRWFYIFCCMGLLSMSWMVYKLNSPVRNNRLTSAQTRVHTYVTSVNEPLNDAPHDQKHDKDNSSQLAVENRALLILTPSKSYGSITAAMLHSRFKFETIYYKGKLKAMFSSSLQGHYSVIVVEDLLIYLHMEKEDRVTIDKYCKTYKVGIIFFNNPQPDVNSYHHDFPVSFNYAPVTFQSYFVSATPFADITKPRVHHDLSNVNEWIQFSPISSDHRTLSYGVSTGSNKTTPLAILDLGTADGVVKIIFGHKHKLWIHKIMFLDALSFLTKGAMKMSKTKLLQIDIDDVFLGSSGTKMKPSDVLELKNAQTLWRKYYVPGFNFYLGFNGKAFKNSLPEEQEGDMEFIRQVSHFNWFDHTFAHVKAHQYNDINKLIDQMELSKKFAESHNMTVSRTYSVAPHHSGVYPVHEPLYEAWQRVWGIQVTSTEEYPHLNPPWFLRGFIHHGIKVLPRQVCGLYTKNLNYSSYPKGPEALERNILGGALFDTVLYNYLNIYMTHQQNYNHDRLAIYTFNKLFSLFTRSTTLKLQGAPPEQLASAYFSRYPKEVNPIWLNPCDDPRHREIWNEEKSCEKLPSLIVVGPQKTGSTALYTFLKLHPEIESNTDSPTSYEELQFFGSSNYNKGLDWYMQFFAQNSNIKFEKSATYFDKEVVAKQMYSLLPKARIIVILLDPIDRAHSWYHHQRAHNDSAAASLSFKELVMGNHKEKSMQNLVSHMVKPGFYYEHIQRLRQYYPDKQIMYINGEKLQSNPVEIMSDVQDFLQVETKIDYNKHLIFDKKKGFYCIATSTEKHKCLGSGKGRSKNYGGVDPEAKQYLQRVFATPNSYLKRLLKELDISLPSWLKS